MEFLDQLIDTNKICYYEHCKTIVELIGQDCKFCFQRYCVKHSLAENHGCTELAR